MVEQQIRQSVARSSEPPNSKETKAFEILVRRHHRRLLAYATAILNDENAARDVVQDAFVVAHRRLDDFDPSRDFAAWMRGIVRNCCHEHTRDKSRLQLVPAGVLEAVEQKHQQWDAAETQNDGCVLRALQQCIGRLPDLLQQAVTLFYLQRLSGAEVAARTGAEESTIRKRLQRARQALGTCITQSLEASA